ncbi:MAG: hypothetical protein WBB42_14505 [Polyangiales bacterium]
MSLMRHLILVVTAGVSASCRTTPASAPSIDVVFAVESDPGLRLSEARISVDGKVVGQTDAKGLVQTKVYGRPGQQLRVEHDCPEEHAAPSEPKFLRFRAFESLGELDSGTLEITLKCRPQKRLAVFIVRAKNGADLPVLLDGQIIAQTNTRGVAHFSTSAIPGTDFIVELDTRNQTELRPQRPTHLMTLPDADEVFVVNQSFDLRKAPRRRGRQRTRITKIE